MSARGQRRPTIKGIGTGAGAGDYPGTNRRLQAELEDPSYLSVRTAVRAGPLPTRISTYPASSLDPLKIDRILQQADRATAVWQFADMNYQMRQRDAHLMGIDRQRRQGTANKELLIHPLSDRDPLSVALAHVRRSIWLGIDNAPAAVYSALSKNCDGWSLSEIIYEQCRLRIELPDGYGSSKIVSVPGIWPRSIEWVHPKHTTFKQDTDECLLDMGGGNVIHLPQHKYLYSLAAGDGIAPGRGYSRAVIWMHFFKHASLRDWNVFLHLYGIPMLEGRLSRENWNDAKMRAVLERAMQAYGTGEENPILTSGMDMKINQPTSVTGADNAWHTLAGFCNAEQSKAVLGSTLTTEAGGASYNLGYIHQDSTHEAIVGDAQGTASDIEADIFQSAIELNAVALARAFEEHSVRCLPEELPLIGADVAFATDREWTPETRMKIFLGLANGGIRGSISQVRRELRYDAPSGPEDEFTGKPVVVPAGAAAVGSADASAGVANPKKQPAPPLQTPAPVVDSNDPAPVADTGDQPPAASPPASENP